MINSKTNPVKVGRLIIGCGHPVSVQSMWKFPLARIDDQLIAALDELFASGCELLRFAVPDEETAHLLGALSEKVEYPLVADIHFDYRLALICMDYNITKIRINPGNIGSPWKVAEVVKKALDKKIPIRVGVNSGSLPKSLQSEPDQPRAMLKAAEQEMEILEKLGFTSAVFSLKASNIQDTIAAYRLFAEKYRYPLHLGVTEAGPLIQGIVKSTIAFYTLLNEGIGDTIRVSLSDTSLHEVLAGRQILTCLGKKEQGLELVSCPTCGRSTFDVKGFLKKAESALNKVSKRITIAVMGCPVNGPGEARHADLGITGAGKKVILFKKGEIIAKVKEDEALERFIRELNQF